MTPADTRAAAWAAHEALERAAEKDPARQDELPLLSARRVVALRFPGCATAILNPDPNLNWDSGSHVKYEIARFKGY